jgi:aldehyde dehydrogenase (NAD+)
MLSTANQTEIKLNGKNEPVSYQSLLNKQREFFKTGKTKDIEFRINQLKILKKAVLKHQDSIEKALKSDLNKHKFEAFATEIGITLSEIEHCIDNVSYWASPKQVDTPLFFIPAQSYIIPEPYGIALIIAPWNYPFKNLFGPVLGAISAGNCMILKPSELAPNTSHAMTAMVREFFNEEYMAVVEGGVPETTELLKEKFDYILFTGGTEVGRVIYQAAAKHLTPVTLELGGKSPTIVDENIDLNVTAKRIAFGKLLNAGQTCVAPDYVLVHKNIKSQLIEKLKIVIKEFYGENPKNSTDFGRIITDKHFQRIKNLIEGNVVFGGDTDDSQRYIAPTIIDNVSVDAKVMNEEIFGPILPIIEYSTVDEAIQFINEREKPLALYIFSKSKKFQDKILKEVSAGGVTINETVMHLANPNRNGCLQRKNRIRYFFA